VSRSVSCTYYSFCFLDLHAHVLIRGQHSCRSVFRLGAIAARQSHTAHPLLPLDMYILSALAVAGDSKAGTTHPQMWRCLVCRIDAGALPAILQLGEHLHKCGGVLGAGQVVAPVDDKVRHARHPGRMLPQLMLHLQALSMLEAVLRSGCTNGVCRVSFKCRIWSQILLHVSMRRLHLIRMASGFTPLWPLHTPDSGPLLGLTGPSQNPGRQQR
jgi:hypothetical protein